tara:strand:+ start:896 stop:1207 length:312 start_codon:yes stop_codon:yes gene_type:complete
LAFGAQRNALLPHCFVARVWVHGGTGRVVGARADGLGANTRTVRNPWLGVDDAASRRRTDAHHRGEPESIKRNSESATRGDSRVNGRHTRIRYGRQHRRDKDK